MQDSCAARFQSLLVSQQGRIFRNELGAKSLLESFLARQAAGLKLFAIARVSQDSLFYPCFALLRFFRQSICLLQLRIQLYGKKVLIWQVFLLSKFSSFLLFSADYAGC